MGKWEARLSPYYLNQTCLQWLTLVLNSLVPVNKRLAWMSRSQSNWMALMEFGTSKKVFILVMILML